jgi:hypothetical protein
MPASTYLGNMVLDSVLRGVAFAVPTRVYVALHTANPGVDGINEVSPGVWPSYSRQDPAAGAAIDTGFTPAATKTSSNAKQMNFGEMDGPADLQVTHASVWTAQSGGQMLVYGPLVTSRNFSPTDEALIKIGKLTEAVI